ncbi:GNAT family N-acetyltransferase [Pontibacter lucknowensis]|uniref:Ribosomal-protein-alanine N-acetyltransferase n=1 Tax=Pontibacter lucknowensis TaxID=1077936 RepID=A0A1N6YBF3_9BACT|nr:GNAT family protein [Pontibacter lucknowensis]SIR11836.1 ribosomal-protein-alanine N-acetyltransferase [Pontibacter lucknowensis]
MTNSDFPHPVVIETERLYLSSLTPAIYQHLFTVSSDEEITAYLGLKNAAELAEEKDKFSKGLTTYFHSFRNFRIIDKLTATVLGRCGYHTWIMSHRRAEVGYVLFDDSYKQKGYMTEALGPVIAYGFEEMGLRRIEALAADYNTPSIKLLKRFGMQLEGVIREHYVVDGINEDSVLYSIIRPDFDRLKSLWDLQYKIHQPEKV